MRPTERIAAIACALALCGFVGYTAAAFAFRSGNPTSAQLATAQSDVREAIAKENKALSGKKMRSLIVSSEASLEHAIRALGGAEPTSLLKDADSADKGALTSLA